MNKKRGVAILAVALTAVFGVSIIQTVFAATGQIFISPASATVQKGSSVTVDVRINPGAATDGVDVTISYDAAKLQYVSQNATGSAYPIELPGPISSGSVGIVRGHLTGVVSTNNSLIVKVTFKALAGGTTATLGLAGNSTTLGAYNNPSTNGASITLANPPAPQEPTPSPTPAPSPTEPKPSSPEPTKPGDTTGNDGQDSTSPPADKPVTQPNKPTTTASGVKIELVKLLFKRAEFQITAPNPVRSYIKYGVGSQLSLSTKTTGLAKQHKISLDTKMLIPGTSYSYVVVTEDQNGKVEESDVQVIKTKGYTVRVNVLGKNNEPLKNQMVTLHSEPMTARTDDNGLAVFEDVAPGKHTVVFEQDDKKFEQAVEVQDNVVVTKTAEQAEPQVFSVVFADAGTTTLPVGTAVALVGVAAIVALGIVLFRSGKLATIGNRFNRPGSGGMTGGGTSGMMPGSPTGNTPSNPTSTNSEFDEMLKQIPGGQGSDPGSVINPNSKEPK